jgi:LSD1 subclass zinc finger protein
MPTLRRASSILPYDVYFVENPDGYASSIAGSTEAFLSPTAASASGRGNPRIVCHQCRLTLEYARGASYVQCAACHSLNAVIEGTIQGGRTFNMVCAICGVSNLAPYGCRFVRCIECQTVSDVSSLYDRSNRNIGENTSGIPMGGVMN